MDQVITFNKTYQERLLEFTNILSGYDVLSASNVKKEWSFYLEISLEPVGWQAIWKIPRLTCEELNIAFPTVVLVYVENVDFEELEATIKILAVQDEIHLPDKHCVPLIQLWPTKEQEKSVVLNLHLTASCLDMLRFFYIYIFMPWDLEEDSSTDWPSEHLETRLRLYYDMRNGTIPIQTVEHLKCLLNEAHRVHARREQIVAWMNNNNTLKQETEKQYVDKLVDLQIRLIQIRSDFEILENPTLRNGLLKKQEQLNPRKIENQNRQYLLVFNHGKVDEHVSFLQQVKNHVNDEVVTFFSTFALALENSNANDTIFLNRSKHMFETLSALGEGGAVKGLYSKQDTVIATTNNDIMLDCNGDVTLENLTVDVTSQCGILVRSGTVTMNNCKIMGDGKSSTHQGIIVLAGGRLNMINCDISQFYTAIVGNSGSSITLQNCEVFNVSVGLRVYDKCQVKVEASSFHHCKDYGVCVETDNNEDDGVYKAGGFAVLEVIPDVVTKDVIGEHNGKGDVLINTKSKLQPINDLFSNSQLNTARICESSDEEMELNNSVEHNSTVIENTTTVEIVDM
ncbi:hypothetical protein ILUMI_01457 [Ignelater luminosus]|uniref:Right handed beta helix domain-containing protein n=1 Tax=Ignelater luminosus TaxID=2038154 RepID=A0A8K0DQP8_IGNLU|nr:hypothetical protein ILUMI_01457 [Ignelater luminosus]